MTLADIVLIAGIIIGIIIALGIAGYFIFDAYDGFDFIVGPLAGLCFGGIAFLILGVGGGASIMGLANLWSGHNYTGSTQPIVALQDGSSIEGRFFLGSGYINGTMQYSYYTVNGNGSKQLETQDATSVEVFDDADSAFVVRADSCELGVPWLAPCFFTPNVTEIHVPAGTIATDLVLDAK